MAYDTKNLLANSPITVNFKSKIKKPKIEVGKNMNVYKISIADYECEDYRIFISEKSLSQKQFEKLVKQVFEIAAEKTLKRCQEKDFVTFIGWNDILDDAIEILKEKGFEFINPISYQKCTFISIIQQKDNYDKINSNSDIFKKIYKHNDKMHNDIHKETIERMDKEAIKEVEKKIKINKGKKYEQ